MRNIDNDSDLVHVLLSECPKQSKALALESIIHVFFYYEQQKKVETSISKYLNGHFCVML